MFFNHAINHEKCIFMITNATPLLNTDKNLKQMKFFFFFFLSFWKVIYLMEKKNSLIYKYLTNWLFDMYISRIG